MSETTDLYNERERALAGEFVKEGHDMNDALNMAKDTDKEKDPNGLDAKVHGAKLDAGKSPLWQGLIDYFPRAILKVAGVSYAGAQKYSWKGWEGVPDGINRYSNAALRHRAKLSIEGPYDIDFMNAKPSQKILHLAQIAWNDLATLELYLQEHPEEM